MKSLLILLAAATALPSSALLANGSPIICTPNPTICTTFRITPEDRFDPFVQHLLVRQQLNALPLTPRITNFYMPYTIDKRGLEEIQIRFLDELRRRAEAEAEAEVTEE